MSRPVRLDSISRMSQALLQGYAMLADSCPDCGVPLVRKPGGEPLCVNCSEEGGALAASAAAGGGATARAGSPRPAQQPAAPGAARPAQPAPVANGIGSPHGGGRGTGSDTDEEEGLLQPPPPLARTLPRPSVGATPGAALGEPEEGLASTPVSQRIADRLLEGWALLDDNCPRCQTPLMRDGRRRLYCVSCCLPVVREGEVQQGQQAQGQAEEGTREPAGPPAASPPAAAAPAAQQPRVAMQQAVAATTTAPAIGELEGRLAQQLDAAALAVGAKLQQASDELAGATTRHAQELLQLVHSCADTLSALGDCKRKLGLS